MKPCIEAHVTLLKLMSITVLSVLEAQEVKVQREVNGYLGRDVSLPCKFIPGPDNDNITQIQWDVKAADGHRITILVFHSVFGVDVHDTFLKEKVRFANDSLTIRGVEKRDAGLYTCKIAAYPAGSFERSTNLVVREQVLLSPVVVSAVVIVAIVLVVVMAVSVYLMFIRRVRTSEWNLESPSVRRGVYIDTSGPRMDTPERAVSVTEEEVVYSDIKLKTSTDVIYTSHKKYIETRHADDVPYSEVMLCVHNPDDMEALQGV